MNELILQGLLGITTFIFMSWALSENKKLVDFRLVLIGIGIQVFLAFLIQKIPIVTLFFEKISYAISKLEKATYVGTRFVFGYLAGGESPFVEKDALSNDSLFIFAFQALPMLMVISSISMLLFHWNILPPLVNLFSNFLKKTIKIGGALGLCSASNIFLGQSEAPLLIRPYLNNFSRSELLTVMTVGMATTSSTLIILYATILEGIVLAPISHILTTSILNVPAAITIARIIIPDEGKHTPGELILPYKFDCFMDAISCGAKDGMKLFLNIIAMIISTLAIIAIVNMALSTLPEIYGETISIERILGTIISPFVWLMGIPWTEAIIGGKLLGTKIALNEVVALISFKNITRGILEPRTNMIMTYVLCGFANLGSIGIQIGILGEIAPERRGEVISLGFKALVAGIFANFMTGTIIGMLWWFI